MRRSRLQRVIFVGLLVALGSAIGLASPQTTDDQTVYVTRTGKKYHVAGCRYLSRSQFSMKLNDAANAGYTPCSVCKPPMLHGLGQPGAKSQGQSSGDRNTQAVKAGRPTGETTATGKPIYEGPRGGRYHYSKSGKKVYEKRRR